MRLIYEKGRPVGRDPIGHYVYLWRDGDRDMYVGQGVAYRWELHLKPGDPKDFLANRAGMSCAILHENLSIVEAGRLETQEIGRRPGLLNKTGGSIVRPRQARANESAAERACRIANFRSSPSRCAVLSFFVDRGAGAYEEAAISAALNMEPPTLRRLLDVVEWRLSDRNNPRFPEIEAIGALYLEGVRGESGPKRAIFVTPGPKADALAAKAWARRGNARG
jgi:transcriptional regulator with XRE-family HTH domain